MNTILSGAWRFGLLGVIAFGVWMAPLKLGTTVLYSSIAAVFILGSGLLVYPLFQSENRVLTCYKIFLPGFLLYSILWCLGWFGIRGVEGEIFGSAAGLAAFTFVVHRFYLKDSTKSFLVSWALLFLFHTLGYTLGGMFYYGTNGRGLFAVFMEGYKTIGGLLWGLCYGLGFGAGLGAVLTKE
ncbi:MAG: hypothetical protein NE330_09780 [Lentisphaeraceae bacterium]|nr:hypothetical protein [Lentisphaeraceae bacterium]